MAKYIESQLGLPCRSAPNATVIKLHNHQALETPRHILYLESPNKTLYSQLGYSFTISSNNKLNHQSKSFAADGSSLTSSFGINFMTNLELVLN